MKDSQGFQATSLSDNLQEKLDHLQDLFQNKKVIVAISGGVDSALLLYLCKMFAKETQGVSIQADHMLSFEIKHAQSFCDKLGIIFHKIHLNTEENQKLFMNPPNRCYYCKKTTLRTLIDYKNKIGFDLVVEGTNVSDISDYRPGIQALKESEVISPFLEAEISKKEILTLAKFYNFPDPIYPSNSCIATRIPYNIPLTDHVLKMIENAETAIYNFLGGLFCTLRVRLHITSNEKYFARIEADQTLFKKIQNETSRKQIYDILHEIGFDYVTIDLKGYQIGGSYKKGV